jgi:trk system potassium uptake protein TrkH
VTSQLSPVGKLTLILLMYVGRIGPLSAAAALARPPQRGLGEIRYAHEEVVLG